jgi:hypothetical protein
MKKLGFLMILLIAFYFFKNKEVVFNGDNQNFVSKEVFKDKIEIKSFVKTDSKITSREAPINSFSQEKEFKNFVDNELKFNQQQIYENELVFCDLSLENEFEESHLKSICLNYDLNQESCLTYKKNCPANGYSAKEEELLYLLHPMEVLSYLKKRDEQEAYQINPLDPPRRDTAYWDKKLEELKILKQRMDY